MEKLKLKNWQQVLVYSVLAVLILLVILTIVLDKKEQKVAPKKTTVNMSIDIESPDNKTDRLFYEELTKGDSVQFEIIKGKTSGWIFQVHAVGQELDYLLSFDFRETEHFWKTGEKFYFSQNVPGLKYKTPIGIFNATLSSSKRISTYHFLSDKVNFSRFFVYLFCEKIDSHADFKCVFYAEEYLKNPEYSDDMIKINGSFQTDSIWVGKRTVE